MVPTEWDRSSLHFDGDCQDMVVTVCNGDDSQSMLGSTTYEIWYALTGNPKLGSLLYTGGIPALEAGECHSFEIFGEDSGNYMAMAYQRTGHPGTGVLWSESCAFVAEEQEEEEQEEEEQEEEEQKEYIQELVIDEYKDEQEEPPLVHVPVDTSGVGFVTASIVLAIFLYGLAYYLIRKGRNK